MELLSNLKRCSWELAIVVTVALSFYMMPAQFLNPQNIDPKIAILSTFMIVAFRVSMGFLSGHIARKMFMPYVNFKTEKEWSNNVAVIMFYILGVYAWVNAG